MQCTNGAFHKIATVITRQDKTLKGCELAIMLWNKSLTKTCNFDTAKFLVGYFYTRYNINTIFIEVLRDISKVFF